MQRILVVAAVRQEVEGLYSGAVSRRAGVDVLLTGMGCRRAYQTVRNWLKLYPCQALVSTGFSGGTRPGLSVGDLILASEVIEARTGKILQPTLLDPIPNGFSLRTGRLVTAKRVVFTPAAKAHLGDRFQAVGVDLETAGIAAAAGECHVPWMAVRVILDPMEQPLWSLWALLSGIRIANRRLSEFLERLMEGFGLDKPRYCFAKA